MGRKSKLNRTPTKADQVTPASAPNTIEASASGPGRPLATSNDFPHPLGSAA